MTQLEKDRLFIINNETKVDLVNVTEQEHLVNVTVLVCSLENFFLSSHLGAFMWHLDNFMLVPHFPSHLLLIH